ncbi:MAG: hypothetical protein IAE82_09615 [Opitutaceae bacterium]|nr:hypothetical protein [Opitutaceae bacterium]
MSLSQGQDATRTLTRAAEVRALSTAEADSRLPATLRGVVTAAEPDWLGKFVLQDESGGIFVRNTGVQPSVGDVVEVSGTTEPGWFVPVIQTDGWTKVGTAPLPPARPVSVERLMAGVEANQRIEITGLVRAVTYVPSQKTMIEVAIGGYRVRVFPKLPSTVNPRSLVAARVRVRGTAATTFNAARRTLTDVLLMVPTAEDFIVEEPEAQPPFEQPTLALDAIARFRTNASLAERLHVKGILTLQRPGLDLFIQDAGGGLRLESRQNIILAAGQPIEAVGFLEIVNFQPVLRDAVVRDTADSLPAVSARAVPMDELREGLHAAEWIRLAGTLLDRSTRPVRRADAAFAGVRTVCTIRHEEQIFTAEYESPAESLPLAAIPLGSEVEVDGIAAFETGDDGRPKAIALLMPSAASMRVVATPSWFTAGRLFVAFAVACVLFAATAAWLLTVSKKNAMLKFLVAEREKAQHELQAAHDQLEQRVKERTEQLKIEMSVRKSAEVEFRAVLTERTRLARELHDTLEQALTGIALQLDTAARLFQRNPAEAGQPLELARGFLKQSQLELRRSIWDLRSRELEQFDLAEALAISSRQLAAGTGLRIEVETSGERRRLPEIVEESLLRIAQEALTNVVKHSGATLATITLAYVADSVALEIRDNGSGLRPDHVAAAPDRHFGLMGMSERAKRIGGRLDLSSASGEGTTVRVVVAHAARASSAADAGAEDQLT